ncbi:metallophosphoesterase [Neobacillus sp. FSL H8-0543]|uniref:metallophosphoesterase family protein n=1 Tax=Neobacillus sp. FSL H8-0543 TaxID=2954672 RepID=UPI003158BF29
MSVFMPHLVLANVQIPATGPKLVFAVISDTHISPKKLTYNTKFKNALKDLSAIAPDYELLAVVGDLTNKGLSSEYDLFNEILSEYGKSKITLFPVIGNHDWYESYKYPKHTVTDAQIAKRFIDKMNVPNLYYDKWIKGYHFIAIASEKSPKTMSESSSNSAFINSAFISDEQLDWLEKTLAIKASSDKPIFVFLHQPIIDTVYGSKLGTGQKDPMLLTLLKKYPQIIFFSGHSHNPLNHTNNIIQDGITMVNTSSVAYTYTFESGENQIQSQGYVVNVFEDKVELKAREFSNQTLIKKVIIPIQKP